MKILIVSQSLKMGGGAEKIASVLGTHLNKKGYKVYYLTFYDFEPKYYFEGEYFSLNEELTDSFFSKILKLFSRASKISKFCKKKDIDIVISFMEEANFSVILSKLVYRNASKIICSVRTNPEIFPYKGKAYVILAKFLYPNADKVVVVSEEVKNILIGDYNIPKERIKTIYNPHYISKYQELSNEPLEEQYRSIFRDSFVFVNVGRLTEAKGQWFLIRSFKKVTEKYPNAKLIILGDGELKDKLQNLINKLNLQNNVYLLGMQKNPFKFLKHSNCFVFSSLWEGLPNTVIEALSLNLPVISTDCKTGPREILCPELNINDKIDYPYYGKYGILTKPFPREFIWESLDEKPLIEEEKLLANLMIKIIEDDELKKRYSKGLERAKDFDIKNIIKEWEMIINQI